MGEEGEERERYRPTEYAFEADSMTLVVKTQCSVNVNSFATTDRRISLNASMNRMIQCSHGA